MSPKKKRRWEEFFDHHAPQYMENVFTKNSAAEIEFLIEELALEPGSSILDVGCGTGRHTVGLARRGYLMTGLDLSQGMLDEAAKAAQRAGVELTLIKQDATQMRFDRIFDAVICLCEGAFGLLGQTDDPLAHDMEILQRIADLLNPGGKLILGALSGTKKIREYEDADVASGRFDPLTLVENFEMEIDSEEGKKKIEVRERAFIASELILMLRLAGMHVDNVWGGTAGNWRHGPLLLDEYELMLVAHKA